MRTKRNNRTVERQINIFLKINEKEINIRRRKLKQIDGGGPTSE